MPEPLIKDTFVYGDKTIEVEWFEVTNLDELPNEAWQQIYVIGHLMGKVPIVFYDDARANLPGGKTEVGESIDETIRRELAEELNCEVLKWHLLGYQRLTEPGVTTSVYQLRVFAKLHKIGEFEVDPGGSVVGYKVIDLQDLNKEIQYGKVGERMMELVVSEFK